MVEKEMTIPRLVNNVSAYCLCNWIKASRVIMKIVGRSTRINLWAKENRSEKCIPCNNYWHATGSNKHDNELANRYIS